MRARGLLDEVRRVRGDLSRTAEQAIGYKELLAHLDGQSGLDEAFATVARRTRSFARRQRMWFRRDPRIVWFGAVDNPCRSGPVLLAWWTA